MSASILLTLQVSVVATLVNIPLALAVSWLVVKKRIRGRFAIDVLVALPLAIPPVAIGYFLLLMLGRNGPVGAALQTLLGIDIVFTWVAAALASAVVSFPLITRTVMVAMGAVDSRIEMSARSLGAGTLARIPDHNRTAGVSGHPRRHTARLRKSAERVRSNGRGGRQHQRPDPDHPSGPLPKRADGRRPCGAPACFGLHSPCGRHAPGAQLAA